jgi:hypothetical protein
MTATWLLGVCFLSLLLVVDVSSTTWPLGSSLKKEKESAHPRIVDKLREAILTGMW